MWFSGSVEGANVPIIIMRCLVRIPAGIIGMPRHIFFFIKKFTPIYTYFTLHYTNYTCSFVVAPTTPKIDGLINVN